jgi:hypothetical protein
LQLRDHAEAQVVSLDREAEREGLSVADQVTLQDARLRERLANLVVPAFLKANGWALVAVVALVAPDEVNIAFRLTPASDRLITGQVIMTLLGAMTVQVGATAVLIGRYLFPGRQA